MNWYVSLDMELRLFVYLNRCELYVKDNGPLYTVESLCVRYEIVGHDMNEYIVYYADYVCDEWLLVRMKMPNSCGCDNYLNIVNK